MKGILRYLNVVAIAIVMGYAMTGCVKDDGGSVTVPELSAELVSASSTTADITLTTTKIVEAAYVAYKAGEAEPEPAVVFATGTRGIACKDGDNAVTVKGLDPLSDYVVYFAGITDSEDYYSEVASVAVATVDFSEDLSVFDIDYDSFKLRLKLPESIAENGNVVKWGLTDIVNYVSNSMMYSDADMMNLSDELYHNYITETTTFNFDYDNSLVLDESGNPVEDDIQGGYLYYYDPIVPGGKYKVMFGEFAEGEHPWGFGQGYYSPLFDQESYLSDMYSGIDVSDQSKYWSGFYQSTVVTAKAPETLEADLGITMNLRPNGGVVSIAPDDNVAVFCYVILDENTYNYVLTMLDNDPANLQWYMTTPGAMYTIYVNSSREPVDIVLEDNFYIDKEATYYLFVTAMGNDEGTTQLYYSEAFQMPDPTEPAPTVEVTAIANPSGEESPYEVWFNVKSPTKDAYSGMYACNYKREWESSISGGYTVSDLIERGYSLTSEEIAAINSDEGLNIPFSSREDSETYLGVMVYNYEGTASEPSVARNKTIQEPAATPVTSELFTSLLGEWTASATISYKKYIGVVEGYEDITETKTCKVVIGDVGYEATLPEEVYQSYYENTPYKTKEEVDAAYGVFKASVDLFNQKTRNQNRLLCQGLSMEVVTYSDYLEYASPYDLFISEDYNGFDSESPVFDFGPKWYLQIAADGSVSVPFNVNKFTPLTYWNKYEYHLVGASSEASLPYIVENNKAETGYFPAEVSSDGNTITINPLVYNDVTYYLNPGRFYYNMYQFSSRIVTPLTLTRGWTGDDSSEQAAAAFANALRIADPASLMSLYKVTPVTKAKSRTIMPTKAPVAHKQVKARLLTAEELKANVKSLAEKRYGKR